MLNPTLTLMHQQNEEYDTNIRAKSDPGLLSPSPKSQRLVFDGVVVPTLAAVLKRRAEEEENDFKKLALLKNVSSHIVGHN